MTVDAVKEKLIDTLWQGLDVIIGEITSALDGLICLSIVIVGKKCLIEPGDGFIDVGRPREQERKNENFVSQRLKWGLL